jgi:hypothetical protein
MNKKILFFVLIAFICVSGVKTSEAALPTFDAINAALNQLRNALMQTQFAQDIALAMERLNQLRNTYFELIRFHSGLDEMVSALIGDPLDSLRGTVHDAFVDLGLIVPDIEFVDKALGPQDIRTALERLTGSIPDPTLRPYIAFEEAQIVSGFEVAQKIREAGRRTREAAQLISDQAQTASPKGAVRLQAQALTHVMVITQETHEAMAKLLELEATQVGQVSREEKRLEATRQRYNQDTYQHIDSILASLGRGSL